MSNNSISNKHGINNGMNSRIPGTPTIEELRMRVLNKKQQKKKRRPATKKWWEENNG